MDTTVTRHRPEDSVTQEQIEASVPQWRTMPREEMAKRLTFLMMACRGQQEWLDELFGFQEKLLAALSEFGEPHTRQMND